MSNSLCRILILPVAAALSGCLPIKQQLLQQQANLLTAEIQQTSQISAKLRGNPNPEAGSQFTVFLPIAAINEVFSKATPVSFDPPTIKNTRINIKSISANFNAECAVAAPACISGLPNINISVTGCTLPTKANTNCGDIEVNLKTTAYMSLVPQTANGKLTGYANISIQIVDVVPDVKVGIFDFALRGFLQQLIQVKLSDLVSQQIPPITVPLQLKSHLAYSGVPSVVDIPTPNSGSSINGSITTPSFAEDINLQVDTVLFLPDGIHIFLKSS